MISIVIPTYNEEKHLLFLLDSLKKQTFLDYEIIVADNYSKDKTKKIAEKFNCKVVKGSFPGKARNKGARAANYENLIFIDADIILHDKNFLKIFLERSAKYDLTTCKILPLSNNIFHKLYYFVKNYGNRYSKKKHVSGQFLFIRKKVFDNIDGYDETLMLGEEHDLAQRANEQGAKIGFFMDLYVMNSVRRIKKEGIFRLAFKSLYSEFYRSFIGKIRKKIIKYEFGKY
jgi:glycosyltransferase involved in cell wall biosynthesis